MKVFSTTKWLAIMWGLNPLQAFSAVAFDTVNTAVAKPSSPAVLNDLIWLVIILALVSVIVFLFKSQQRFRSSDQVHKDATSHLEQRVVDRTDKLRNLNAKLYDEIARHEATEDLLRQTQDSLHGIINSMPSVIIGVNTHHVVTHWNLSAEKISGQSVAQALGKNLKTVYPSCAASQKMIRQVIDSGSPFTQENVQQSIDGDIFYKDITVYPLISGDSKGAVIRIDDVTMRVHVENMMIQNERMMSLGELSAGMAHEINNPLSTIIQSSQNIKRRLSDQFTVNTSHAEALGTSLESINQYLKQRNILHFIDNIQHAGEQSAKIVSNMLAFSRFNTRDHAPVELAKLIEHSLELASHSFRLDSMEFSHIQITRDLPADNSPQPKCSSAEIQQVLMNVLRNAAQAIANQTYKPGVAPTIKISLDFDDNFATIKVADNGTGMKESVRRHVFEPFFTTKDVGKGTGLGLSVSYFIITEHHNGHIQALSTPGEGSQFIIKLPLAA